MVCAINQKNKKNGFSLIEILLVIAIFIFLASASFVFLARFSPKIKLSASIRDLANSIKIVQRLALTEQVDFSLKIYQDTNQYEVIRYGTSTSVLSSENLSEGVVFEQISGFTDNEVLFNPYGAVKEAGDIILINSKGDRKTIEVRPSGFIRVR